MRRQRFPHYETPRSLPEVESGQLDAETFREDFVRKCRPVVIRDAAKYWPVCHWRFEDFANRLRDVPNVFGSGGLCIREPFAEYAHPVSPLKLRAELGEATPPMSGEEFIQEIAEAESFAAYGVPLTRESSLARLAQDGVGRLEYFDGLRPSRFYSTRAFIYKGGYTDWHFHYADETITIQAIGEKEFLLLPPDTRTFEIMWRLCRRGLVGDADLTSDAEAKELRPYLTKLRPGDGLYIPVFWWHAVEPVDADPGVTIANVVQSLPEIQFDPRFAAVRWNVRTVLKNRPLRKLLPLIMAGGVYAMARHPLRPPHLPT